MSQVPTGGKWLKAKELKQGDKCKIIEEANWETGEYQGQETKQYCVIVNYNGEERKLKLTMASNNEIAPVYGKDSNDWIGKELNLEPIKVMVGGDVKLSILATPINGQTQEEKKEEWPED